MWIILLWVCAVAIAVLALKFLPVPYLWIFPSWSLALFVTAVLDRARRPLWFNGGCLLAGLALFEGYFWAARPEGFRDARVDRGDYAQQIYAPDEELGWAPRPGVVANQRTFYQGDLLYDVTYTIGANGLRVSSPDGDAAPQQRCIPFFGCSFTFGQGLEDDQTLPFQVDLRSDGRHRTFNFGVMGYGAHQMLSALQHGLVDEAMRCDPTEVSHVVYQAISDHVRRAAGRLWWNRRGPSYRLTGDGEVRPAGRFEDRRDPEKGFVRLIGNQLMKSMTYEAVIEGEYVHKFDRETLDLYLGIVGEARDLIHARYPCSAFHVLLWDEDNVDNRAIRDGLRKMDVEVHLMSDILPDYEPGALNEAYLLEKRDPHPNARANALIAQYVVREILPQPGRCERS
jgi:hypothetical protein